MRDISAKGTHTKTLTITSGSFMTSHKYHLLKSGPRLLFYSNSLLQHQSCVVVVLSCSQPLNLSLSVSVIHEAEVSFRPYALVEACLQSHTHTHTHIHELVFSLCPYALSGDVLLTNWPFHRGPATRPKQSAPNWAVPDQLLNPHIHTHTHTIAP